MKQNNNAQSPPGWAEQVKIPAGFPGLSAIYTRNYRPTGETCGFCGETLGEVLVGGEWQSAPCLECHRRATQHEWVRHAQEAAAAASALHRSATLDNFIADMPHRRRGLDAARLFVETAEMGRPTALLLWSEGYGTGKTHLAAGIAAALRVDGWRVTTWLEPDILSRIRSSYGHNGNENMTEYHIIREAVDASLLIIDDLGRAHCGNDPNWYQEKLFRVINARYQRGPLVVTTNLRPENLPQRIGGAAMSRLWEMTRRGRMVVDLTGPDWRFSDV